MFTSHRFRGALEIRSSRRDATNTELRFTIPVHGRPGYHHSADPRRSHVAGEGLLYKWYIICTVGFAYAHVPVWQIRRLVGVNDQRGASDALSQFGCGNPEQPGLRRLPGSWMNMHWRA